MNPTRPVKPRSTRCAWSAQFLRNKLENVRFAQNVDETEQYEPDDDAENDADDNGEHETYRRTQRA